MRIFRRLIILLLILITSGNCYAVIDWIEFNPTFQMPYMYDHKMVFDHANSTSFIIFGECYAFDGNDWIHLELIEELPPVRFHYGMSSHSLSEKIFVFGGSNGTQDYLGDTWEWDGAQWEEKFPLTSPSDRVGHIMTYLPNNDVTVLFGGYDDVLYERNNETWLWDGSEWQQIFPEQSPAPRSVAAFEYFDSLDGCVLFGGTSDGGSTGAFNDTWLFDGMEWIELITDSSPPARYWHVMVNDSSRNRLILFGGSPVNNSTWEFDGIDWHEINTAHRPSERSEHAACFDSVRSRVVLFGGWSFTGALNDTWEYYDAPPTETPTVTPTPTITPTPTLTPTATPTITPICRDTGVTLIMPADHFTPGSPCSLTATLCNLTGDHLRDIPFYCILDIAGQYWFYPSWSQSPDHNIIPFLTQNAFIDIPVIPEFVWPAAASAGVNPSTGVNTNLDVSNQNAHFLAAITDPEITTILGEIGIWEFSWE